MTYREAAGIFIYCHATGHIYGVSRRNDFTQWGCPGGKVDDGETTLEAALRELREETGVVFQPECVDIRDSFTMVVEGQPDYMTTFYLRTVNCEAELDEYYDETIVLDDEMCHGWINFATLIANSPFSDFNMKMFRHFAERLVGGR